MKSPSFISGGFSFFSPPGVSLSLTDSVLVPHFPISSIEDSSNPVEFVISSTVADPFIDFSNSYLYVKFHATITDKDGERNIQDGDNISLVNNFFHSLTSGIDIFLQETLVDSQVNQNSAYRSYFQSLINYSEGDKEQTLTEEGFYKDTATHFDKMNGTNNTGFYKRKQLLLHGKKVVCVGKPGVALFSSNRFMIPGVNLRLRFCLSKPEFFFLGEGRKPINLHLDEMVLYLRKVTPTPNIRIAIEDELLQSKALYPVTETSIKTYSIPQKTNNFSLDNLISGRMPREIIIGFVHTDAYLGKVHLNPFNFKHYDLSRIDFTVNGRVLPPCPLTDEDSSYSRTYRLFLESAGVLQESHSNIGVTRSDFCGGNFLLFFNLTPDLSQNDHNNPIFENIRTGNARLDLTFKSETTENVTLICYQTFDKVYSISYDRNVSIDI